MAGSKVQFKRFVFAVLLFLKESSFIEVLVSVIIPVQFHFKKIINHE